jgi:uncharacterized protein (DUF885 family)
MSGNLDAVEEAVHDHIATFHPTSGDDLDQWAKRMAELPSVIGKAVQAAADGMTDEHIHPAFIESLREYGSALASTGDAASDAFATHRAAHRLWLTQ